MQEDDAMDFYERIVEGTKRTKVISLETDEGYTLDNVEMSPVSKTELAGVIERLPDDMFDAVEEAEGDAEAAEENMEGDLSAVNEDTVESFEDLLKESLSHPKLAPSQMNDIVDALGFEVLFELGSEVINMSVEQAGDIRSFREQE